MQQQKGFTLIGLLIVAVLLILGGILVMRIIPVYVENYEIIHSINALNNLGKENFTADPNNNIIVLHQKLDNQLSLNGIADIKPEQITIQEQRENNYLVMVKYTVIKPLFKNVSLLFNFNETEEVTIGSN